MGADNVTYSDNTLIFEFNGVSNPGVIYLQNDRNEAYAVGTNMFGNIFLRRWDEAGGIDENSGFSLVELLVAIVVGGIIISAAYMLFISNQRTYIIQDELVNIQQQSGLRPNTLVDTSV